MKGENIFRDIWHKLPSRYSIQGQGYETKDNPLMLEKTRNSEDYYHTRLLRSGILRLNIQKPNDSTNFSFLLKALGQRCWN